MFYDIAFVSTVLVCLLATVLWSKILQHFLIMKCKGNLGYSCQFSLSRVLFMSEGFLSLTHLFKTWC